MDANLNLIEYFVHHEDVRRARPVWEPRQARPRVRGSARPELRPAAPMLMRHAPMGITLRLPDGRTKRVRSGSTPPVTITGAAGQPGLNTYGRKSHALVEIEGEPQAQHQLAHMLLGVEALRQPPACRHERERNPHACADF